MCSGENGGDKVETESRLKSLESLSGKRNREMRGNGGSMGGFFYFFGGFPFKDS